MVSHTTRIKLRRIHSTYTPQKDIRLFNLNMMSRLCTTPTLANAFLFNIFQQLRRYSSTQSQKISSNIYHPPIYKQHPKRTTPTPSELDPKLDSTHNSGKRVYIFVRWGTEEFCSVSLGSRSLPSVLQRKDWTPNVDFDGSKFTGSI